MIRNRECLGNINGNASPHNLHDYTLNMTRTNDNWFTASVNNDTFFVNDSECFYNSEIDGIEELDSACKSSPEKSLFDSDENESIDIDDRIHKLIEECEKTDTINWIRGARAKLENSYSRMSSHLAVTGLEFRRLSRQDFISMDEDFEEKLYESLLEKSDSTSFHGLSVNFSKPIKYKQMKRPPVHKFIINMLLNKKYCPGWIRWEDYEEKKFRFVKNEEVAKLWGMLNGKKNSRSTSFSRLLRYYYVRDSNGNVTDNGFLAPAPGRRVYKFGKKATGLETDNPNFVNPTTRDKIN